MIKLSWWAVGFACIAAVIQPFAPMWLFISFILVSVAMTGVGVLVMERRWKRQQLVEKMDKAFGKPNQQKQVEHREGKGPLVAYPPAQPPHAVDRGTRGRF